MYLFNFRQHYLLVFVVVVDDVFVYLGQLLQIPIYIIFYFKFHRLYATIIFTRDLVSVRFRTEANFWLLSNRSKFLFRLSKAPQYYIYAMI